MLHRFLLVSSSNGTEPVTGAKPQVFILPPGNGSWIQIDAAKITELGRGWYRADLGEQNGDERLVVSASAAGALEWRDLVDLDRAAMQAAAVEMSAAAKAIRNAEKAAGVAQASAADSLQQAAATADEALDLLNKLHASGPAPQLEMVTNTPAEWAFHDPGNTFSRKNVGNAVELTCNGNPGQPVQLYDSGHALAAGQFQLSIDMGGKTGARFRFEVLQHGSPYYGLGKSPVMQVDGDTNALLNLKNDNNARFRLWFTGLAKPGDKYLVKSISLKEI